MNIKNIEQSKTAFQALDPNTILNLVEKSLGIRCTNLCRPMASYINRVYELESEDGAGLVVKFYRPGRWSQLALQDEHDFILDLAEKEIPVIAPLFMRDGSTLGNHENISFTVFPKKGGRIFDEYTDEQRMELGRLLARVHATGKGRIPHDRITMAPDKSTRSQLDYILNKDIIPSHLIQPYREIAESVIDEINPLFQNISMTLIHGDCHFANLIYRPGESFFIIDFDDMSVGPAVQDFWMLLPEHREDSAYEIETFLEGYETFYRFDRRELLLIEPLRAMRFIHYSAWCAHQFIEDGFSHVAPNFGTPDYWNQEINDLKDQLTRIRNAGSFEGNY